MSDLISRQAAIDAVDEIESEVADGYGYQYEKWRKYFCELPSAQPEIIRCKDCKHWKKTYGDERWSVGDCDVFDKKLVMCKGFCAWAERRTDETD